MNQYKIYFSGSIRGGGEHRKIYGEIIEELKKYGEVLTEFVGDMSLTYKGTNLPTDEIYKRDISFLDQSNVVVAEVTTPSLGVGYEIAYVELRKPVICLYKPEEGKALSAMIKGNPNVKVYEYNSIEEVKNILRKEFEGKFSTKN
jgi:nucleoside 2-deoxyribosyltransferase